MYLVYQSAPYCRERITVYFVLRTLVDVLTFGSLDFFFIVSTYIQSSLGTSREKNSPRKLVCSYKNSVPSSKCDVYLFLE